MRTPRLVAVIVAVLGLTGCGSTLLAGVVTDLESGEPIGGATITVGDVQAVSDGAGAFEVDIGAWETPVWTSAEASGYPTWRRLRSFPRGLDRWNVRLSKTGRYR